MNTAELSPGIELLVDHLRANRKRELTLGDVAATTEVLLNTMQRYFASVDTSIYREFQNLSAHISNAREEIAQMRPNDLKQEKIPRAGKELEAIVQATEEATGTIMDAAEEVMSADTSDAEAYQSTVTDACMRIFEACSFQDITGQRITKVVRTLTYIEDRLGTLQQAWGPNIADVEPHDPTDDEAALLNGPALDGEGIAQGDVDSLLKGDAKQAAEAEPVEVADAADDGDESPPTEAAADDDVEEASASPVEPGAEAEPEAEAETDAEPKAKAAESAPVDDVVADTAPAADGDDDSTDAASSEDDDLIAAATEADSGKQASQADIDALFD